MTQYKDYYADDDRMQPVDNSNDKAWWPLLMLPLFFFFGWVANDYMQRRDTGPEAGIGGGPYDLQQPPTSVLSPTIVSPIPTEALISPTETVVSPTVLPTTSAETGME